MKKLSEEEQKLFDEFSAERRALKKHLPKIIQGKIEAREFKLGNKPEQEGWYFVMHFGSKVWYDYFADTEHNGAEKTRLEGFYYPELDFRHQEMPEVIDLPSPYFKRFVRMNGEIKFNWRDLSIHVYPESDPHPLDWMLD